MPDSDRRCLFFVSLLFFFSATTYTLVIWLIIFHYRNHNWTLAFCLSSSNKVLCLNIQPFPGRCFYFTVATSAVSPGQLHLNISSVSQVEIICSDFKIIILSLCRWEIIFSCLAMSQQHITMYVIISLHEFSGNRTPDVSLFALHYLFLI